MSTDMNDPDSGAMLGGTADILNIVYSNNAPNPLAKVVADLRMDVASRFSVPLTNVTFCNPMGVAMSESEMMMTSISEAPPRMLVRVLQEDGGLTEYDTLLEKRV